MLLKCLRGIARFLWSWAVLVSGALSVPLVAVGFYVAPDTQRVLWYGFAALTFFAMPFLLLAKERQRAERLHSQLVALNHRAERQPLNQFTRKIIEDSPVVFTNELLGQFWNDIRQAAVDEEIRFFGRRIPRVQMHSARGEPLVPIEPKFWRDHPIEYLSLLVMTGAGGRNLGVIDSNERVRSGGSGERYADLHINQAEGERWAKQWVEDHR